jgi:hypothetical protein
MDHQQPPMEQHTHLLSARLLALKSQYTPIEREFTAYIAESLKGLLAHDSVKGIDRLTAFLSEVDKLLSQSPNLAEYKPVLNLFSDEDAARHVRYSSEEQLEMAHRYIEELTLYKEKIYVLLGHLYLQTTSTDKLKFVTDLAAFKILALIKALKKLGYIKNEGPGEIATLVTKSFTSKNMVDLGFESVRKKLYKEPSDGDLQWLADLCDDIQDLVKKVKRGEETLSISEKDK